MNPTLVIIVTILAYLLGSVSPSLVAGRLRGIDIREHGSGNAGLTNVVRVLGWKPGVVVAIIDVGKGFVAVGLVRLIPDPEPWAVSTLQLAAGLAVVAGHVWPLYSGFRGGKGAATGAGVLLAISPGAWVVCVGVFGVVLWRTRYVSVASMTAAAVSPVAVVAIDWVRGRLPSWTQALLCIGAAGVIIWAHRSNIRSLRNGSETPVRFGT